MTDGRSFAALRADLDGAQVRAWAIARGLAVSRTGGLPRFVYELYATEKQAAPDPPAPGG
jgi:hypothetical protein